MSEQNNLYKDLNICLFVWAWGGGLYCGVVTPLLNVY